jgi:multicomponent Na+:H+ antiporter subunit D
LSLRFLDLRIDQLAGAAKQMPLTCAAFVIGGLSLIGVPGTAGFISKWLLIEALMAQGTQGLVMVAIVLLSSLMAVVYVWRTVEILYFKTTTQEVLATPRSEAPLIMLGMIVLMAALNIVFGVMPDVPLSLAQAAAEILAGDGR